MTVEIKDEEGKLLALILKDDEWKKGLNFYSQNNDFIQAGTWGYEKGKVLLPHIHLKVERTANKTQEVVFIKTGRVLAKIYAENGKLVKAIELSKNDTIIMLNGGHGYDILENDTYVLEIKNGPYVGAEKDRKRF